MCILSVLECVKAGRIALQRTTEHPFYMFVSASAETRARRLPRCSHDFAAYHSVIDLKLNSIRSAKKEQAGTGFSRKCGMGLGRPKNIQLFVVFTAVICGAQMHEAAIHAAICLPFQSVHYAVTVPDISESFLAPISSE